MEWNGLSQLLVDVPQKELHYPLKIEKGILNHVGKQIADIFDGKKIVVFTDKNVEKYHGEALRKSLDSKGFQLKLIVLEPGEQTKQLVNLSALYSELVDFNLTRSDLIVAFGGGVIGDLAGYVAASFLRGIQLVQIPTTLLAQVDSSVGGKVAVDLPEGKNLVGAFYHPDMVLIDPNVLESLTDETFSAGMAEVIKYGCIKDKTFFDFLKQLPRREDLMENVGDIIKRCCEIKRDVVESDEKDRSERMLLNFGHTLGHAIEAYYNYEKYTHGQAISIGMVEINKIAEDKGLTPEGSTEQIIQLLKQNQLPTVLEQPEDYVEILPLIDRDKKNLGNQLTVILLDRIGGAARHKTSSRFFTPLLQDI